MTHILPFLVPIIIIFSISTFLAIILNRRVTETIVLSITLIIVILFLFGLLNFKGSLLVGYFLLICFAIYSLIFSIRAFIKDKEKIKKISLISSLVIFLGFFMISFFINYKRMFTQWDEFSFWGASVKMIYSFDVFATFKESTLYIKSYIPGTSLLGYFFTRPFKEFIEFPSYIASNILFFSIVIIFFKKIDVKNFLLVSSYLALPLLFDIQFYSNLYVDQILGIMFSSIILIYYYYDRDEDSLIKFLSVLSVVLLISLTKHMGFLFALIALLIIGVDIVFFKKDWLKTFLQKEQNKIKKSLKILLLFTPLICIIVFQLLWKVHLSFIRINSISDSVGGLFSSLFSGGELLPYQKNIIQAFLCFLKEVSLLPGKVTFDIFFKIFIVVIVTLLITSEGLTKKTQKRLLLTYIGILLGNLFYLAVLLLSYIFIFNEYEGTLLNSSDRYISSYIVGVFFSLLLFLIVKKENNKLDKTGTSIKKEIYKIINMVTIFLIFCYVVHGVNITGISYIMNSRKAVDNSIELRAPFEKINDWSEYIKEKGARIYIISQGDQGLDKLILMHTIAPSTTEWIADFSVSATLNQLEYPWIKIITAEDWSDYVLTNYDFIYIFKYDESFVESYGQFFDEVRQYWLYRVSIDEEGGLSLTSLDKIREDFE